jgi:hypothetical protein
MSLTSPIDCRSMTAQTSKLFALLTGWQGQPVTVQVVWRASDEPLVDMVGVLGVGEASEAPDAWGDPLLRGVWPVGDARLTIDSYHLEDWTSAGDDAVAVLLGDVLTVTVRRGGD